MRGMIFVQIHKDINEIEISFEDDAFYKKHFGEVLELNLS